MGQNLILESNPRKPAAVAGEHFLLSDEPRNHKHRARLPWEEDRPFKKIFESRIYNPESFESRSLYQEPLEPKPGIPWTSPPWTIIPWNLSFESESDTEPFEKRFGKTQ